MPRQHHRRANHISNAPRELACGTPDAVSLVIIAGGVEIGARATAEAQTLCGIALRMRIRASPAVHARCRCCLSLLCGIGSHPAQLAFCLFICALCCQILSWPTRSTRAHSASGRERAHTAQHAIRLGSVACRCQVLASRAIDAGTCGRGTHGTRVFACATNNTIALLVITLCDKILAADALKTRAYPQTGGVLAALAQHAVCFVVIASRCQIRAAAAFSARHCRRLPLLC